jgi:hypothetical protein
MASAVIALTMPAFNAFGVLLPGTVVQGTTIRYMSFYKGALLFLLINIATGIRFYSRAIVNQRSNAANDNRAVAGGPAASKFRTAAGGGLKYGGGVSTLCVSADESF